MRSIYALSFNVGIWTNRLGRVCCQLSRAFLPDFQSYSFTLFTNFSSHNYHSPYHRSSQALKYITRSNLHLTIIPHNTSRMTTKHGFAAYPPKVEHIEILGYMQEDSGIFIPRDIGRSFELDGKVYLVFGDTFCKNSDGEFSGTANNTIAIVEDNNRPLKTKYIEVDENGFIKPFIQFLPGEEMLQDRTARVVLWAFGGIVKMKHGSALLWYQKSTDMGGGNLIYHGTGIAKVIVSDSCDEQPVARRIFAAPPHNRELVFSNEEPRMGTFSAVAHGEYFYLFGDRPDGKIILARVYGWHQGYVAKREAYFFWDGEDWVEDWKRAVVVIEGMQQGAIVRSKLFGEDRPFLFVGTSKWADSLVYMGASARLEGPWVIEPVCKAEGIAETTDMGKWMYCIYPQLWASDEEKAELMVTWSEQCPGGVIGARIKLAGIEDDGGECWRVVVAQDGD